MKLPSTLISFFVALGTRVPKVQAGYRAIRAAASSSGDSDEDPLPVICYCEDVELVHDFDSQGPIYARKDQCECQECGKCDPIIDGDPHLMSWNGDWYDYMGQCDLKLLFAPQFDRQQDMEVQVR